MNDEIFNFPFETNEMRLLYFLSKEKSVKTVSEKHGRDQTTITRQLSNLSKKHPVLQKNNGLWTLTPLGQEIAKFSHNLMNEQKQMIDKPCVIRIATTKEFSEWVLTPLLSKISFDSFDSTRLSIHTETGPIERSLLDGRIDIAITCGKPIDPLIKYKKISSFPLICISSDPIDAKNKFENVLKKRAVEHTGLTIKSLLDAQAIAPEIALQFDHIAGVRGACKAGIGWSVLPSYSVQNDIDNGELFDIPNFKINSIKEQFSVWYLRDYSIVENFTKNLIKVFKDE